MAPPPPAAAAAAPQSASKPAIGVPIGFPCPGLPVDATAPMMAMMAAMMMAGGTNPMAAMMAAWMAAASQSTPMLPPMAAAFACAPPTLPPGQQYQQHHQQQQQQQQPQQPQVEEEDAIAAALRRSSLESSAGLRPYAAQRRASMATFCSSPAGRCSAPSPAPTEAEPSSGVALTTHADAAVLSVPELDLATVQDLLNECAEDDDEADAATTPFPALLMPSAPLPLSSGPSPPRTSASAAAAAAAAAAARRRSSVASGRVDKHLVPGGRHRGVVRRVPSAAKLMGAVAVAQQHRYRHGGGDGACHDDGGDPFGSLPSLLVSGGGSAASEEEDLADVACGADWLMVVG
jgi:hypothetical protein